MHYTEKKIAAILRQHGYKLTPQRRHVLSVITRSHEHLTPAAIYEKARREGPGIGLVTVYRTLEILASLGLICEGPKEAGWLSAGGRQSRTGITFCSVIPPRNEVE